MKKMKILLLLIVASIFCLTNVNASEADRANLNNKTLIYVDGRKVYVSVHIDTDMVNAHNREQVTVKGVSARYDSPSKTFYVSLKRSEINKVFGEKYNNVYEYMQVNIDYHDIKDGTNYYYFKQNEGNALENKDYRYYNANEDYLFRNYKFLEICSSAMPLAGTAYGAERYSYGGGIAIFEGTKSSLIDGSRTYEKSEFDTAEAIKIFDFPKTNVRTTIIEDVQIDLGENDKIVSADSSINNLHEKNINNFYGEYFENNKLKYSWTMYDKDGKPVIIDVNTAITLDNSENEEEIMTLFANSNDLKDKVMIVTFDHHGELNGKAKISLYVGDKFAPGTKLNIYHYLPSDAVLDNVYNPYGLGDVNKDGRVTILDVTILRQYLLGTRELDAEALKAADYNLDGTVNEADADLIQKSLGNNTEAVGMVGLGDVNKDGRVTILDVTILRQYLLGMRELDAEALKAADYDQNGTVNEADADLIQKSLAEVVQQIIVVDEDGYITFELERCSEYVLADANAKVLTQEEVVAKKAEQTKDPEKTETNKNLYIYGGLIGLTIVLTTSGVIIYKKKKNRISF